MESNLPCDLMGIFNRWVSAGSRDGFKAQMNSAIATSALFPGKKPWSTRGTWISEVLMRHRIALRHSYCDTLLALSAEYEGMDFYFFLIANAKRARLLGVSVALTNSLLSAISTFEAVTWLSISLRFHYTPLHSTL